MQGKNLACRLEVVQHDKPVLEPQLHEGEERPAPERMEPVRNELGWVKPQGGFWTSTFDGQASEWIRWCLSENFKTGPFRCWLLIPDPSARVYHVDGLADLERLVRVYGYKREPYSPYSKWCLDFERMAQQFDALHLTRRGERETRHTDPGLYTWDVESTLWFRWRFTRVIDIGLVKAPVWAGGVQSHEGACR